MDLNHGLQRMCFLPVLGLVCDGTYEVISCPKLTIQVPKSQLVVSPVSVELSTMRKSLFRYTNYFSHSQRVEKV